MDRAQFKKTMNKLKKNFPACQLDFADPDIFEAWFEEFAEIPLEALGNGCRKAIAECEYFPSCAKLKSLSGAQTPDREADQIFYRVWSALRLGNNPEAAKKELGPKAWACVLRLGRWYDLVCAWNESNRNYIYNSNIGIIRQTLVEISNNAKLLEPPEQTTYQAVIPEPRRLGRPTGAANDIMTRMYQKLIERENQKERVIQ